MTVLRRGSFDPPEEGTIDIQASPEEAPILAEALTKLDQALKLPKQESPDYCRLSVNLSGLACNAVDAMLWVADYKGDPANRTLQLDRHLQLVGQYATAVQQWVKRSERKAKDVTPSAQG